MSASWCISQYSRLRLSLDSNQKASCRLPPPATTARGTRTGLLPFAHRTTNLWLSVIFPPFPFFRVKKAWILPHLSFPFHYANGAGSQGSRSFFFPPLLGPRRVPRNWSPANAALRPRSVLFFFQIGDNTRGFNVFFSRIFSPPFPPLRFCFCSLFFLLNEARVVVADSLRASDPPGFSSLRVRNQFRVSFRCSSGRRFLVDPFFFQATVGRSGRTSLSSPPSPSSPCKIRRAGPFSFFLSSLATPAVGVYGLSISSFPFPGGRAVHATKVSIYTDALLCCSPPSFSSYWRSK